MAIPVQYQDFTYFQNGSYFGVPSFKGKLPMKPSPYILLGQSMDEMLGFFRMDGGDPNDMVFLYCVCSLPSGSLGQPGNQTGGPGITGFDYRTGDDMNGPAISVTWSTRNTYDLGAYAGQGFWCPRKWWEMYKEKRTAMCTSGTYYDENHPRRWIDITPGTTPTIPDPDSDMFPEMYGVNGNQHYHYKQIMYNNYQGGFSTTTAYLWTGAWDRESIAVHPNYLPQLPGDGSYQHPYQISKLPHLMAFNVNCPWAKETDYFVFTDDIDAYEVRKWDIDDLTGVDRGTKQPPAFLNRGFWSGQPTRYVNGGGIMGNGHCIKNLKMGGATPCLIKQLNAGFIHNLGLKNVWSYVQKDGGGGLCDTISNGSHITRCYVTGTIIMGAYADSVSQIARTSNGTGDAKTRNTIQYCYVACKYYGAIDMDTYAVGSPYVRPLVYNVNFTGQEHYYEYLDEFNRKIVIDIKIPSSPDVPIYVTQDGDYIHDNYEVYVWQQNHVCMQHPGFLASNGYQITGFGKDWNLDPNKPMNDEVFVTKLFAAEYERSQIAGNYSLNNSVFRNIDNDSTTGGPKKEDNNTTLYLTDVNNIPTYLKNVEEWWIDDSLNWGFPVLSVFKYTPTWAEIVFKPASSAFNTDLRQHIKDTWVWLDILNENQESIVRIPTSDPRITWSGDGYSYIQMVIAIKGNDPDIGVPKQIGGVALYKTALSTSPLSTQLFTPVQLNKGLDQAVITYRINVPSN